MNGTTFVDVSALVEVLQRAQAFEVQYLLLSTKLVCN